MPNIPADVVGQAASTTATATQNAATLTQSPQSNWYDVWSQTGSGLAAHSTDPQYIATHTQPGAAAVDTTIRMAQAMGRKWERTDWNELKTGMKQQASAVADQASQLWDGKLPDGTSMTTLQRVGAAFGLLGSIEQLVTMPLGAIPFPAFPAIRVMDMDIGLPHAHMHPPNLTPPNPVPVPLPSTGPIIPIPFLSGASKTLINMLPAARCGDMGLGIWCGGYFPMYEVFLGSANVWIEGNRAGRVGVDITKHCIFSAPKPSDPPLGPMFGTTINCSPNVMIGGIPVPSLTSMAIGAAFKALFKGVGRVLAAARNAQKASTRWAAASARLQSAADNVLSRIPGGNKLKDLVNRGICKATGHPVDVASGQVFTDSQDFELPGPLPFKFERVWFSGSPYNGPLGHGWHHSFDLALYSFPDGVGVRLADGRMVAFPRPAADQPAFHRGEKLFLHRTDRGYHLETLSGLVYHFGQPSRNGAETPLDHVRDANGNRIQLERDRGRLVAFTDSGGRRLPVATDSAGRVTEIRVPDPDRPGETYPMVSYQYDRHGDLVKVSDALGHPFRYEYLDHQLVRETDRSGLSFYFMYDGPGVDARCVRTWGDGDLFLRDLKYDTARRRTRVTDSLGHATEFDWNTANLVVKETDPLGGVILTEWGPHGDKLSITDQNGGRAEFAYDPFGRLVGVTDPTGAITGYEYDAAGNRVAVTDADGGVWRREYDERRNVIAATDPLGHRHTFTVDSRGLPLTATDPLGHAAQFSWTASGLLATEADRTGRRTVYEYDLLGRLVKRTDGEGNAVRLRFERRGLLTAYTDEAGGTFTLQHNPGGNLSEAADPLGRTRRYRYALMGRVAEVRTPSGRTTTYAYDTEGRLAEARDPADRVWRFVRDANGNVIEEHTYDGRVLRYTYDRVGFVTSSRNARGQTTKYHRDPLGRVLKRAHPDGQADTYLYTPGGRVAAAANPAAEVTLAYDPCGRVAEEAVNGRAVRHTYDANGHRTARVSPLGRTLFFQSDAEGRLLGVDEGNTPVLRSRFDFAGREVERTAGSAVWNWDYRPTGETAAVSVRGQAARLRRFEYNPAGDPTAQEDNQLGRSTYTHNADGYLTAVRHADGSGQEYEYDRGGDVRRPDGVTLRRDADGQVVEKTTPAARWEYEYDGLGQLTRARTAGGPEVNFAYDPFGRRVRKAVGASSTEFVWDGQVALGEVGERAAEYLFRPGTFEPLAVFAAGAPPAVLDCDPLGIPRTAWHPDGGLAWQAEFEPFGEVRAEGGEPGLVPFRYPGQYADAESGLVYNWFRYLDPEQRAYTTPEPLGLYGNEGVWQYGPSPLAWIDPYGLSCTPQSLYGTNRIDMRRAPAGSGVNAAGHPRNGPWFWREMLRKNPQQFSASNRALIRSGRAPVVDSKWIQHNPMHSGYSGDKLVHHHMAQGPIATGLPESAHREFHGILHPD